MSKKHKQVSAFSLEGRFLSFIVEDGYKIKRLRLATAKGELCIKLSKEARASVTDVLTPGSWIGVVGEQTVDLATAEIKYKAFLIKQAAFGQVDSSAIASPEEFVPLAETPKPQRQATILMCQKSDCMKRGGRAVCQALQSTLSDRGLQDQVVVKGTGCMKQCKAGPNLVMPNKTRYSRIAASDIPKMIDQHFPAGVSKTISTEVIPPSKSLESTLVSLS